MNASLALASTLLLSTCAQSQPLSQPNVSQISHKKPLPFGVQTDNADKKLWQLIVEELPAKDAETEWYSLKEIAPLLGITPHALSKHARDLWPDHDGHYRLNFSRAVALIRRVCYAGKKVPRPQNDMKGEN